MVPASQSTEWTPEADDSFFENFTALSWKRENRRLQAAREEECEKDQPPPRELDVATPERYKLGKKEWDELYIEVLYTIKHKLGASSSGYAAYTEDLYEYAKDTFRMSHEDHQRLMAVAQEEKPPIPVLNITVVEAQGLEAKDPNGFSDPYCMLGIQLDPDLELRKSNYDDEGDRGRGSPSRRQGLRRFGTSFKRRDRQRSNSESGTLPAKFIRTTTVKAATLNPKWNEKFRLDIDDVRSDRLHLDIWDHDDETSVFDAARKLNEVSGLKGLGRYFKEVAQSARTSIGDNVDDFLGCVNVPLEDVSSVGVDRWFPLQGRSHRSTIQGQIHLKLQLGTREDRGMAAGEDNWREVMEHQELLWIFIEHELRLHKGATYEWAGDLPQQALTILHQHAIQGDITELQQSICQWITYSRKHREVTLDYALLYQLLDELDRTWTEQEEVLSMDEEAAMAESFNVFADHCMELLLRHRDLFPPANSHAWHKLKFMLKCLALLYTMGAFKSCCPFRSDLHVEITNTLKKGTLEWFISIQESCEPQNTDEESQLKSLIDLTEILNRDLQKAVVHYNHLFKSTVEVRYPVLIYKQLERQLADEISKKMKPQSGKNLNTSIQRPCSTLDNGVCTNNNNTSTDNPDTLIFELFLVLQEFIRFRENLPEDELQNLALSNCHVWFADVLHHWFSVAKSKVRHRIHNALELDKKIQEADPYLKYSTSAMDTAICFIQLKEFWRQLSWPDAAGSYPFVFSIVQAICSGAVLYASLCHKRLYDDGCQMERRKLDISQKVLTIVNNMEHVQKELEPLAEELEVERMLQAIEQQQGQRTADQCRSNVESLLQDAQDDVLTRIESIVNGISEHMRPTVKKFIFHLAWAPEKLDPEKALTPLMEYLETNLKTLYASLLDVNFNRVLETIWKLVLEEMSITVRANFGKEKPVFFDRLSSSLTILVDFFHANGKALPLPTIQNVTYQELEEELRLHKSDTAHLIELYYLQRLEDQSKLYDAPYGCLTVKTHYDHIKESVCVEVLSARDLIPCDPNGLSDPFVILELVPKHSFPNVRQQKTSVHKKTLFPFFNEYFEFPVKLEACRAGAAALSLVVMDHDIVTKNDFEGEAYVALSSLPGVDKSVEMETSPMELVLMHPRTKNDILTTLSMRSWDKDATELLKQEKMKHS